QQIEDFYRAIPFDVVNDASDRGEDWDTLIDGYRGKVDDLYIEMGHFYGKNYGVSLWGTVPGIEELIRDLKKVGTEVYILSNWSPGFWDTVSPRAPIVQEFDGSVISSQIGMVKPDPRIYQHAMDKFNLQEPSQIVFADDREVNVEAAQKLGWHGHIFRQTDQFRQYLRSLGVSV
ncbi:MAG: HAD-IA family hydrolase, partial [Bifidobacteriaceae bacterium]|nr:HAD-IA family hydrolase [Bifidobacteriaceae bacterium]